MSTTAIVWLFLFIIFSFRSLSRPVFAVVVYLMSVFALPLGWWWGRGLLSSITTRWGLVASLVLVVAVLFRTIRTPVGDLARRGIVIEVLYVINALLVHFSFADNVDLSWENYVLLAKQGLLLLLMLLATNTRADFKVVLTAIFVCSTYIGYEVVINDEGSMVRGRLELGTIPDATDSNILTALLLLSFPIAGYLLLGTREKYVKLLTLLGTPLILDTVLRCNSRGGFLAMIAMGGWIFIFSPNKARKQTLLLLSLGVAAVLFQAKNEKIWERFYTTFESEENRDGSAASRLDFWKQALVMLSENPLGAGGEAAFKSELGFAYLADLNQPNFRAVHNGYLDIACGWGVQGISLYAALALCAWLQISRLRRWSVKNRDTEGMILAVCLQAMVIGQLVATMFISTLDNEWMTWIFAICLRADLFMKPELSQESDPETETEYDASEDGDVIESDFEEGVIPDPVLSR